MRGTMKWYLCWLLLVGSGSAVAAELQCRVWDDSTRRLLPVRVYLQGADGEWYFSRCEAPNGSAVEYRKQRFETSVEMHTTVSAHPFAFTVPRGKYTLWVEHGKEYLPVVRKIVMEDSDQQLEIPLRHWIDMSSRGWFSGDTHVHRSLEELPNVVLAEDLNVALPLSYWVTTSHTPPTAGNKNTGQNLKPELIQVDDHHVIYPINTEYEIFTVQGQRHTLGAVFVLNHQRPFELGAPPVRPIAAEARKQGALLDLDKHSWPWSMMLVPVMQIDLFELANNHVWRTDFGFSRWTVETLPIYMRLETDEQGFTEWGWIDFGFQNYYALLNCGYRLRPTAGTASGVHPVPLGFGRVYVKVDGNFSYKKWIAGLDAGHSFVTTGPMLDVTVNQRLPGATIQLTKAGTVDVEGTVESPVALDRIELVINGTIRNLPAPRNEPRDTGGFVSPFKLQVDVEDSSWVAVRALEARQDGRVRFAHSAPVHIEIPNRPLRPRKEEVEYLMRRVQEEIDRNKSVLSPEALREYEEALSAYRSLMSKAR